MHIGGTTDTAIAAPFGHERRAEATDAAVALSQRRLRTVDANRYSPERGRLSTHPRRWVAGQAQETTRVPKPNRYQAAWQDEEITASEAGDAVLTFSNRSAVSGVKAVWPVDTTCPSLRGTGRAAAPRRARQKHMERQTQVMSKIAMSRIVAFSVPLAADNPRN
jgi:hypothetical protein